MANAEPTGGRSFFRLRGRELHIFGRAVMLPASRIARIAIGLSFLLGACLSILPVFGIWMLPLGLLILSIDIAIVRRWRRRTDVRWARWRASRRGAVVRDDVPPTDR